MSQNQLTAPTPRPPLPPGPGKLHMLRMMGSIGRDTVHSLSERYGDPFTLPSLLGPMVIAVSPEGNKAIFSADPETFVPALTESIGGFLRHSVLLQSGGEHRRARKLLSPPFHGARMRTYGKLMQDIARGAAARLPRNTPFKMIDLTQSITLDVILRAVFGVADGEEVQRFRRDMLAVLDVFSPILFVKALQRSFFGFGPWARFQRANDRLRERVFALIAAHRATLEGREDILSLLLHAKDEEGQGLSDQEIMDQLMAIVLAGHETTAVMLAWTFYLLHKNPGALMRLREEVQSLPGGDELDPEVVARLPFLEAVCNETLRIYPPVQIIHRRLARPLSLLGWELPVGTIVAAGAHGTHRIPGLYPEPEAFRPERFFSRSFSPFEFLPWGGGARRCLGAAFAMYEMKQVLATLLRRHRFQLLETGEVGLVHRPGTVGPKGGIRMLIES